MNRIGLVGLGYLGKIHLKILLEDDAWQLAGVYDINKRLCLELADQYQIKAFDSYAEMLEHCDAIDIVTPSNTHFEIAEKAIIHGKHVFIEKPVTSDVKDAKTLRDLATEASVCVQVGHVERFNPAFIAALPYLSNPKYIEIHRLAQYNPRGTDVSVVLDLMSHDLDLILNIVHANVKKIQAIGSRVISQSADLVNARIEFDNGCVANITTNRIALKNVRKFRVFTDKYLVSINLLDKSTYIVKNSGRRQ
ncbi:MAG: Gfo/Idh/MocA family oxidoreductase [Sphingobacteriaceae bacterium]|nr:Gfo/Idh/MocA family oxidoreductase [Sphingobacteriaceae bacterium]